jgi:Zn-dependent protease with chaperone function
VFSILIHGLLAAAVIAPGASAPASSLRQDDLRLASMAYRIATLARPLCPEPRPISGLLLHHLADYTDADRTGMVTRYGLDRGAGVLSVVEDSPAARAGLLAGDVIVSVDGVALALPVDSDRAARDAVEDRFEDAIRAGPVELRILRSGTELGLRLEPESGCPSRVRLARSGQVNGFATRRHVVLTTAILNETRSDDELAVVLGHELAHVALKHPDRLEALGIPRGILRGIGKNADRVQETEREADRLGLRLAQAAGYDVKAALPFWQRFYAKYDGPQLFRTHPTLQVREQIIRGALVELEESAKRPELGKGPLGQR